MEKLKFINEQMTAIGIPYEFGVWSSEPVPKTYFVGELPTSEEMETEDGKEVTTLLVTGFHRGTLLELEEYREKIKNHFHPIFGLRGTTDSGSIAVFFDGSFYVPSGEADLKKIQINLKINEWKGML